MEKIKKLSFSEWFQKSQKNLQAQAVSKIIQDVEMKHLRQWARANSSKLAKTSLRQAVAQTKSYIAKKDKQDIAKRKSKMTSFSEQEKKTMKLYKGKGCLLNGFPAAIMASNDVAYIVSNHNCLNKPGGDIVKMSTWHYVKRYYPYFGGGIKLYKLEDSIDKLKERIETELDRPNHAKQEYIIYHLNHRIDTLLKKQTKSHDSKKHKILKTHLPDPMYHREIIKGMSHMEKYIPEDPNYKDIKNPQELLIDEMLEMLEMLEKEIK